MAITVKHTKVSLIPDGDDTSLIRPSDWNQDHTLIGLGTMAEQNANSVAITGGTISGVSVSGYVPTTETITAGTGLTGGGDLSAPMTISLANTAVTTGTYGNAARTITQTVDQQGRLTNIFDQPIAIANTQVSGLGTASTKDAGVANGVATLDGSGTVPISQLPAAVLGALSYQGTWNASTNTPTLTSSVGTKGYYYVVSVAGTTNLNGITDWQIGDWAVYNGTAWQKIDNTDSVTSVNGFTGAVVLTTTNIAEGTNLYYTDSRARTAISAGTGLSYNSSTGAMNFSSSAVATWAATPSSANLAAAVTDETGSGSLVFGTSPTISSPTISGGSINGASIGGSVAGDGTFDILTANVSRLGNSTATYYQASNGLVSTGTYTATPPSDGLVIDYSTGFGRFSDFGGDGFQWYNAGVATTKLMELSSSGALATTGTVTANGVLLTGNLGTVTSVAALTLGTTGTDLSSTVANGTTTPVITLNVPTASATNRGALSAADWTTFNNKQPAGSYLTTVTADAPLSGSGTSGSHLVISQANTSTNGYLSSTDWNTFNNKQAALVSGTNIKTVNGTTLLGSGNLAVGTVTSVGGTGTVNGLTLSGTVTSSGNLTLSGTLDLSSPPAIGGTTPAAITGTTITATKFVGVSGGTF